MATTASLHVNENNNKATADDDDTDERHRLLTPSKRKRLFVAPGNDWRAYWLGTGLFLALFSFWLLDTLKDPIFGALVDGNLDRHQPRAKLLSVCTTLLLVCALEALSSSFEQQEEQDEPGTDQWQTMSFGGDNDDKQRESSFSSRIFIYVCLPYTVFFGIMASLLQFNPLVALNEPSTTTTTAQPTDDYWYVVGYCLYAAIESFGSITVATFWSFCNSSLSLDEAERFYGTIIALAQLGAIMGSTMVTMHVWSNITLIVLACLITVLHVIVMWIYTRRFAASSSSSSKTSSPRHLDTSTMSSSGSDDTLWSGVYLILRHNYVLLILGASCLYEISLTCLNYQMTLLGWSRFEETDHSMSFKKFMGRYGQMVNISSLFLSWLVFPWLIRRFGLRVTIRMFPTLLFAANVVAFVALPGNLTVLFISMSVLKAMTYSVHDPSKEILYIPTSKNIKLKSKFWIDVVGARVAKAIGSSINRYAGSVDKSIRVASAPSLLTSGALWWVCYSVGQRFDSLVEEGVVVGDAAAPERRVENYNELYYEDED